MQADFGLLQVYNSVMENFNVSYTSVHALCIVPTLRITGGGVNLIKKNERESHYRTIRHYGSNKQAMGGGAIHLIVNAESLANLDKTIYGKQRHNRKVGKH